MYTVCKIFSRANPYAMGFRKKDKIWQDNSSGGGGGGTVTDAADYVCSVNAFIHMVGVQNCH